MSEPIEATLQELIFLVNERVEEARSPAERLFLDNFAPLIQRLLHLWQGYQRKHGVRY